METKTTFFIGGAWVAPATDRTIDVVSPYTEAPIARVPEATEADIDRAVAAAQQVFESGALSAASAQERSQWISALSQAIQARAPEFADTITREMGAPASWCLLGQVLSATMVLDAFAEHVLAYPYEQVRPGLLGNTLVRRVPVGVAAGIIPWNVPLFIAAMKFGAALAAGVPMVLKPAPETPLDAYLLAEVVEQIGLPKGCLNVVPAGREVGEYLVRHPGVDKVSFTGSTAAGRKVGAACGELLKRCTLELGGKSAAIVLDDADLAMSIPMMLPNAIMNNGQACLAQTRILAPKARYREVVDTLAEHVRAMTVGDPQDPSVMVGPLVANRQRDRVEGYLAQAKKEGARAVVGGGRPADQTKGWFIAPTVFADVDNRMTIAREEVFGPVLCVIPFEDDADAVRIANDSEYGLSGSVWTQDGRRGVAVAKRVRTGTYGVNAAGTMDLKQPFGGFKASGVGRECGPEGIDAYTEIQTIVLPYDYQP